MKKTNTIAGVLFLIMGLMVPRAGADTGTLAPSPYLTVLNSSGAPISGACIWTYVAGTSTAVNTYTSKAITVANSNPIVADTSGQFVAYLVPGQSYKFVFETACIAPAHGAVLRTQDGIDAVPAAAAAVDVIGTAGEALAAGGCAYMSSGLGGKVAGSFYKCDGANGYSSTTAAVIGITPSAIALAASGSIRIVGTVTGLSSLTIGVDYYAGTAGALTATAPANVRKIGTADTTTSIIIPLPVLPTLPNGTDDFRIGASTTACVPTSDVTASTSIFLTPCWGNRIALPDALGTTTLYSSTEISIAVPATTSQVYDVFVFANAGVPTLELLAWTNDTTRATAIVRTTTGFYTKSGDLTRRYVGSVRTTTVSGQTEDSIAKRYVWNYYNRAERPMRVIDATASWNYTTNTLRQARATATNQLDFVVGVSEDVVVANVSANASDTTSGTFIVGIGLDSTSANATGVTAGMGSWSVSGAIYTVSASWRSFPGVGRHVLVWLEASASGTVTTWYGADKFQTGNSAGISGTIKG